MPSGSVSVVYELSVIYSEWIDIPLSGSVLNFPDRFTVASKFMVPGVSFVSNVEWSAVSNDLFSCTYTDSATYFSWSRYVLSRAGSVPFVSVL